jgi:ATP-dependent Clp protease ATP-binding subunit ClpA
MHNDSRIAPEWFDAAGRAVVDTAEEEARRLNHNWLGTEHLLLGALRERPELQNLGGAGNLAVARVRAIIEKLLERPAPTPVVTVRATPRAREAIRLARAEARRLGRSLIDPECIVLGILRESQGVAVAVLLELGVGPDLAPMPCEALGQRRTEERRVPPRQLQPLRKDLYGLLRYAAVVRAARRRYPELSVIDARGFITEKLTTVASLDLLADEELGEWQARLLNDLCA